MSKKKDLSPEQIDRLIAQCDKISAELEASLAQRYQLDFAGKTEAERSAMIRAAIKEHERRLK